MTLTSEQRSAIAQKAVATRKANIAKINLERIGGRVVGDSKPASLDTQLVVAGAIAAMKAEPDEKVPTVGQVLALQSLDCGSIISYYDGGSRFGKLIRVGEHKTIIETIPAYGCLPRKITVPTKDVRAWELV